MQLFDFDFGHLAKNKFETLIELGFFIMLSLSQKNYLIPIILQLT